MRLCDDINVDLVRYLDNTLNQQELQYFRAHLGACGPCQCRVKEELALSRLLLVSRPLYPAPAELRNRVAAAVEKQAARNRSPWNRWRRRFIDFSNWKMLVAVALVFALCLIVAPNVARNVRAASYAKSAVASHSRCLNHELSLGIRTNSPEAVTAWFAGKVPFEFRLPRSEMALAAKPAYKLVGASLVEYRGIPAAMVLYEAPSGTISLMVESSKTAAVAGGDEVRYGALTFHYRTEDRFQVITWSAHGLSYALVSSVTGSARGSCMVCHQSMADHGQFRAQP
jgi:anti-sigma factor RsiW